MLYRITDGTLAIGGENLLEHFDFEIKGRERIAITGPNGSGKTTFLRLIAGELFLERDDRRQGEGIYLARNVTIGMLRQQIFENTAHTVQEEMMVLCPSRDTWDRERFEFEQEYDRIFTGFGFAKEDKEKLLSDFSGGEQTKIAMVRLLLEKPDILLLDEPTNHLDHEARQIVKKYLADKKGFILVSHDRDLLDACIDHVLVLNRKSIEIQSGNFSSWWENKMRKDTFLQMENEKHLRQIGQLKRAAEQSARWAQQNENTKIGYDPKKEPNRDRKSA